jgi:hypothetical protein
MVLLYTKTYYLRGDAHLKRLLTKINQTKFNLVKPNGYHMHHLL